MPKEDNKYIAKLWFTNPRIGPKINPSIINTGIYTIDALREIGIENAANIKIKLIS